MTQQLSLFDFGELPQSSNEKKKKDEEISQISQKEELKPEANASIAPEFSFYFFVADNLMPAEKNAPNERLANNNLSEKKTIGEPKLREKPAAIYVGLHENSQVPSGSAEVKISEKKVEQDTGAAEKSIEISAIRPNKHDDLLEAGLDEDETTENKDESAGQQVIQKATTYRPDEKLSEVRKRGRKSFREIDEEVDLIEVPEDDVLFKKQYYSIAEVASWFRVNTSLLRFWENEFPILKPRKNKKGDRLFRPEDIKNIQVIYYLLRQRKFTIDGARKYMKAQKGNIEINLKLINSLNKFKDFLLELKANVNDKD